MTTTVPTDPDMSTPSDPVAAALDALRTAGADDTEAGVRVLAVWAHRGQLDYDQLVGVLSTLRHRPWLGRTFGRAEQLLYDIEPHLIGHAYRLALDVATYTAEADELAAVRTQVRQRQVSQAIGALRLFGGDITGGQAAQLLPMWAHYARLDDEQVDEILAAFPGGPAHLAPVSPAPTDNQPDSP